MPLAANLNFLPPLLPQVALTLFWDEVAWDLTLFNMAKLGL